MKVADMEIKEKIIHSLSLVLECQITEASTKDNTITWDSLNHARILIELNEIFNIRIPFSHYESLTSVHEIIKYMSQFNHNIK